MSDTLDATGTLAEYSAGLEFDRLPQDVQARARLILADTVGVILAASGGNAVSTAVRAMPSGAGECTVVGRGADAQPDVAALINGIGAHDIELDDGGRGMGHAAAVNVPAVLAIGEYVGASLSDVLAGLTVGYDVQGRVAQAMGGTVTLHGRGFHPSSVCGSIGAAAGCARVLRSSVNSVRSAIGLGASQSSGLLTYKDERTHMAKSFQTGIAARNGVTAALLAVEGYMAAPDALGGRHNVIAPFGGDKADPAKLVEQLGERFEITQTIIKRHASCIQSHAAVDALLDQMRDSSIGVAEIDSMDVELAVSAVTRVDGNPLLTHNIQYVLAVTAYEGSVTPAHFAEPWPDDERIRSLASRISVSGSAELEQRFPAEQGAVVTLHTGRGTFGRQLNGPYGGPMRPITADQVQDKFLSLAAGVIGHPHAAELWEAIVDGPLDSGLGDIRAGLVP